MFKHVDDFLCGPDHVKILVSEVEFWLLSSGWKGITMSLINSC